MRSLPPGRACRRLDDPGARRGSAEGSSRSAMRIGVFHEAPYYLRYYDTTLRALADRGHRLLLARPDRYDEVKVPAALRKRRNVSTAFYPWTRSDGLTT